MLRRVCLFEYISIEVFRVLIGRNEVFSQLGPRFVLACSIPCRRKVEGRDMGSYSKKFIIV
jgi:hypothetical protein